MSGQSIGGLVGTVLGGAAGAFFGPVGLVIGSQIGSLAGGLAGGLYDRSQIDDTLTEQESLTDLRLQTSTFGQTIPQVWGRYRVAGNVFWSTDKVESEMREETGGGKGGGPTQVTVTKTYSISLAIGLADTRISGPIDTVLRVWRDTTLVYDAAQNFTFPANWTFYGGTSDQTPDPVIEAIEGVGNVPAYRYLSYLVIEDDPLGRSGRTYNYTFEIAQAGGNTGSFSCIAASPTASTVWAALGQEEAVWRYSTATYAQTAMLSLGTMSVGSGLFQFYPVAIDTAGIIWVVSANENKVLIISEGTPAIDQTVDLGATATNRVVSNIVTDGTYGYVIVANPASNFDCTLWRIDTSGGTTTVATGHQSSQVRMTFGQEGDLWCVSPDSVNEGRVVRIDPVALTVSATITNVNSRGIAVGDDGHIWVADSEATAFVRRIDPSSDTIIASVSVPDFPFDLVTASDGYIWVLCVGDIVTQEGQSATRIDPGTDTGVTYYHGQAALRTLTFETLMAPWTDGGVIFLARDSGTIVALASTGVVTVLNTELRPTSLDVAADGLIWIAFTTGRTIASLDASLNLTYIEGANSLSSIVPAIADAVGLTGLIDITDLPQGSPSFALVSIQAARAPLEFLAEAFRFYAVESGQQVKFRERYSGDVLVTLTETDLAAGEEEPELTPLDIARRQDLDLPRELNITYVDPEENYQDNTQRAQFALPDGAINTPRTLRLPLALTAQDAKRIAEELLAEAWVQRNTYTFQLSNTYAYLEPGDRITVTARGITHGLIITEVTYGRPGLLEIVALPDAFFVRGAFINAAALVEFPPPAVTNPGDSTPLLLNLPVLNSSDTQPRYHVLYVGVTEPWEGGALYRSPDGGASYTQIDATGTEGITGTVALATADADWHFLDLTTTISVVLEFGSLTSVADMALYNGVNRAMVGAEMIAFGVATLTATRTYTLSRLLRGQQGTEYTTGTHGAGETFVLLDTGTRTIAMDLSQRNVSFPFKAATLLQDIADATAVNFTPTAENLNPWTVAQPTKTLTGADWVFTWYMRSRFNVGGIFGAGIGFDPDFMGFKVVIYSDATYVTMKRTIVTDGGNPMDTEAQKTVTYTEAQQITDFGSGQSAIYAYIFQVADNGISPLAIAA